jgi:hypothetical protein
MGKLKEKEKNEQRERLVDSIVGSIGGALKEDVEEINIYEVDVGDESDESGTSGSELALREDGGAVIAEELPVRKIRYSLVCIAVIMLFFTVVGAIHTVGFVTRKVDDIVTRRDLKDELALFIYPVVINDPPPFESVGNLQDSTIIVSAIWRIILVGDKSHYENEMGVIYIPAADVELAARELFGTGELVHQSVLALDGTDFIYSSHNNSYVIPENHSQLPYSPYITEVTNVGETFTVTVDYMMPNPLAIAGIEHENDPVKTMVYTITRSRERMTIDSVAAGDFVNM